MEQRDVAHAHCIQKQYVRSMSVPNKAYKRWVRMDACHKLILRDANGKRNTSFKFPKSIPLWWSYLIFCVKSRAPRA